LKGFCTPLGGWLTLVCPKKKHAEGEEILEGKFTRYATCQAYRAEDYS